MGNCIRHESVTQWGGDDWGSQAPERIYSGDRSGMRDAAGESKVEDEDELLLRVGGGPSTTSFKSSGGSAAAGTHTQVKVKITKRKLEELLGKVEVQGLPVQQVLAHLMNAGDRYEAEQRAWRPNLQSIPEVN
ncbi:uncharacterized protein LOC131150516 [Malania oleifera]|uniref:uncharacterized protein LOC131150516 n=1 Tax=Malania oleifera TaxID=397392 RepID=UPI0025ADFF89|nr:uncharacterized protein LOC131150516 [Malania oleifera]